MNIPADGVYTISVEGRQAAERCISREPQSKSFQTSSVFGWYSRFHDRERLFSRKNVFANGGSCFIMADGK